MIPSIELSQFRYFTRREDYLQWLSSHESQASRREREAAVIAGLDLEPVTMYCHAHGGTGKLVAPPPQGGVYNWRESGICDVCESVTRVRLAAEWMVRAAQNYRDPRIYVTEQLTPLYKTLRKTFPDLIGSEYVPDTCLREMSSETLATYTSDASAQIRHEDVCELTFPDASLDLIGSFDVLEHVPDYPKALAEIYRVLRIGGQLILTAPFLNGATNTLVRARIEAGGVKHLETPEYHGNPTLPSEGVLCFYHFGWDLLDAMRSVGFSSVALLDAWGIETAVFGDQTAIVATK